MAVISDASWYQPAHDIDAGSAEAEHSVHPPERPGPRERASDGLIDDEA